VRFQAALGQNMLAESCLRCYVRSSAKLGAGHYETLLLLVSFFLYFTYCSLISKVARSIVTKFWHVFDGDPFKPFLIKLRKKFGKHQDFGQIWRTSRLWISKINWLIDISGMKQPIVEQKTSSQTAISPQSEKTGPEFLSTRSDALALRGSRLLVCTSLSTSRSIR